MSTAVDARRTQMVTLAAGARSWALFVFCIGAFLSLVAAASEAGTDGSAIVSTLEGAAGVAMAVSAVVFVLAHLVRLGALLGGSGKGVDERPLPAVGRWARTACRACCMILVAMWLAGFVLALVPTMRAGPGWPDGSTADALGYGVAALFAACLAIGLASVVVWLVAEAVAGFREPRAADARRRHPRGGPGSPAVIVGVSRSVAAASPLETGVRSRR